MAKVIYEPHPVTPERKEELRSQGYRIIDARFAPAEYEHPDAKPKGRQSRGKADKPEASGAE